MPTIQFETTVTDRMIRIPDEYDVAVPATISVVVEILDTGPQLDEVDALRAEIEARARAIRSGELAPVVNGVSFKDFSRFRGRLPKDWKFDREEANERR